MSESEAAVVITGAFESVVKARWSYVESGHVDMPLGLKIFDGTVDGVVVPPVWSFAEVNEISGVDELEVLDLESDGECDMAAEHERDRVAAGQHCVEVFVLTSAMGWPYTKFIPTNARCVFVRREMVRVWRVVEEQIQMWPNCTHQCLNKPYILLGTPGIGKSLAAGRTCCTSCCTTTRRRCLLSRILWMAPRTSSTRPAPWLGELCFTKRRALLQ
ncbi:putative retrotransposon hot spot protein 4 (RHS4) [Trypanosoma vivax]|nr:putative retrotransposon hot spot protein 4 (RHS4) [Trypanosoma vivax]